LSEPRSPLALPLLCWAPARFPTWLGTSGELDEIEAHGAKSPPFIFAIGSVFEPASQLEGESRANVSIGTVPAPVPETARAQEAVPLAQPRPARSRAIATSYKREAIQLAAIPLVITLRRRLLSPVGTSEKCSASRRRPAEMRALHRYITGKPSRAPPARVLFL